MGGCRGWSVEKAVYFREEEDILENKKEKVMPLENTLQVFKDKRMFSFLNVPLGVWCVPLEFSLWDFKKKKQHKKNKIQKHPFLKE